MNSLSLLSRHLDSTASLTSLAQPPPSDDDASTTRLKRSETWSKPFYFRRRSKKPIVVLNDSDSDSQTEEDAYPSNGLRKRSNKKRSLSSPALFNENGRSRPYASASASTSAVVATPMTPPESPVVASLPVVPSSTPYIVIKDSHLYRRLRKLYLVRAFVVVWNTLCSTYDRLLSPVGVSRIPIVITEHGGDQLHSSSDEKSSEDEEDDEGSMVVTRARVTKEITRPQELEFALPLSSLPSPPLSSTASTQIPTPSPTPPPSSALRRNVTPFHLPKTLVLDLDETLIHSTSRPMRGSPSFGLFGGGKRVGPGHTVEVVLNDRRTMYHVYKRPFVDYFLRKVSRWYTLVIFTASIQEYADPVIDWLDAGKGVLGKRYFRDSCTQLPSGTYTKNLTLVEDDLSRVCLVDNSPVCYSANPANGIPIEGWTHDLSDEALLDLLPVLDSLRFTGDVRRVLGLRGFNVS